MSQPNCVLDHSIIHWSENQPINTEFGDGYYGDEDGTKESDYVFVQGNRIPARWQEFESAGKQQFSIIETGFGSGLNFLNVADAWKNFQSTYTPVHLNRLAYTSIEGFPLKKQDLLKIINSWPKHFNFSADLLESYPLPVRGIYNYQFSTIELNLIFMPLDQALAEFEPKGIAPFDCLFLDGFAPQKNKSMWHPGSLRRLSFLCKQGSTFSTYTAASKIRHCMTHNGYTVTRSKGFGRKREMLTGILDRKTNSIYKSKSPWYEVRSKNPDRLTSVAIIGAGVAGCATANALARQGIKCLIIDKADHPGGTCGELDQSIYSPLLSADFNLASQFYWHAYQHLHNHLHKQPDIIHDQTGVFFAADDENRGRYLASAYRLLSKFENQFSWLEKDTSEEILGLQVRANGLYSKYGGWLDGRSLCENLIDHKNIHCQFNSTVNNLSLDNHHWLIETSEGLHKFKHVVLCTGSVINLVDSLKLCRLDMIKGQTTMISNLAQNQLPKTIINNGHYLVPAPAKAKSVMIGASYEKTNQPDNESTIKADIDNLIAVRRLSKDLESTIDKKLAALKQQKTSSSKTGTRLTTRDHLPVIGPVPDMEFYQRNYTDIIRTGRLKNCPEPKQVSNLYINTAHGSRGATASILSGKLIASLLTGKPYPLSTTLYQAVHPARFFVRDVKTQGNEILERG